MGLGRFAWVVCALMCGAVGFGCSSDSSVDGGAEDTGVVDSGTGTDSGSGDSGALDSGPGDSGGPMDAGPTDSGVPADAAIDSTIPADAAGDAAIDAATPADAALDAALDSSVSPDAGALCATAIELTPTDVSSAATNTFSPLPSASPAAFGFGTTGDIRSVSFDVTPSGGALAAGTLLTTEYASVGVAMNGIRIDSAVYGGPASPPNATEHNAPQVYTFSAPVSRVGIINTSPDQDSFEAWSGPDGTGTLLLAFRDQFPGTRNFNIDRFVGAEACAGTTIGSIKVFNASGDLELDELVFKIAE